MNVTIDLGLSDTERWVGYALPSSSASNWSPCCPGGHATPEGAATHAGVIAADMLSAWARQLAPPASGAIVLARAS